MLFSKVSLSSPATGFVGRRGWRWVQINVLASPLWQCAISKVVRLEGWPSRTATGRMHCFMHRVMLLIGRASYENGCPALYSTMIPRSVQ